MIISYYLLTIVICIDVILFQASLNLVIVGSNTQTLLQVFVYDTQQITKTLEIVSFVFFLSRNFMFGIISCLLLILSVSSLISK